MLTGTAQVLGQLISAGAATGNGSWLAVLKFIIAGLTGPIIVQEISEFLIAYCKVPFAFKPFVPRALSGLASSVLMWTGVDPASALIAGGYLTTLAHLWNQTPWALDLELKLQGKPVVQPPDAPPAAGPPPAIVVLLIGAMLLAGSLKAGNTWALSNSGSFGTSIWNPGPGGSFSPSGGGPVVADEFSYGYGSVNADGTFTPILMLAAGAGFEERNSSNFLDAILGMGTTVPGTSGQLVAGPVWRMFTGDRYPGLGITANFQFGQPFWVKK